VPTDFFYFENYFSSENGVEWVHGPTDRVHGLAVHESMTFTKYESSAPRSAALIDSSEPLSLI
jgi:hypothetical protein